MKRSSVEPSQDIIDISADVQKEDSDIEIQAGVTNLRVLYADNGMRIPVTLSIETSTGLHRGVHMSRLVKATSDRQAGGLETWLRSVCERVNQTQPGALVTCDYELPFDDQFAKVRIRTTQRGMATYTYTITGMTACPCSKKMIGVGHMQRAELTMTMKSRKSLEPLDVVSRMSEVFSENPKSQLKRLEEAKKILSAQANPKFAEDLVRGCIRLFPNALRIESRCFESIHFHEAAASWSRPGAPRPL